MVHGQVDHSFLTDSVNGSLDGEYFRQDRVTVLAGRLPPQASTTTVIITPAIAKAFGTSVGGTVSYRFQSVNAQGQPSGKPFTRSYRVAAIVEVPPALVDDSDDEEGSIFPPGATRQLLPEYYYAWIGLRLAGGTAAIPVMQQRLAALAADLQRQARKVTHQDVIGTAFSVNRSDVIHNQVQQAITPEAVALSVFGAIAALALLVLTGQGLAQLVSRSAPDTAVLRALGVTRGQAMLAAALPGVIPVLGGVVLAVAAAVAVSPLAPVGPVRRYDPDRGFQAAGSSAVARAAAAAGLPATAVVGTRNTLEPGSGGRAVPVRSALIGAVAAVTAVVAAVVFNASLGGLASHPARYGWNWDLVVQAEASYNSFLPGKMEKLLAGELAVAGWSEFGLEPPTTSGRALSGPGQIELGPVTLRQLGKKVGDRIRIGIAPYDRTVVITGTVTMPSFGVGAADHPSLGRGGMLGEDTLLAAEGQANGRPCPVRSWSAPRPWPLTWHRVRRRDSEPGWSIGSSRPTRMGRRAEPTSSGGCGPRRWSIPSRWAGSRSRWARAWPRRRCYRWP